MKRTWRWAALLALSACASPKQAQRLPPAPPTPDVPLHLPRRADERLTAFDLNHDGKPDVWDYTVEVPGPDGKPQERLDRKELDMNSDGRADIVKWFDPHERLARETLDLDFDGRVDQVNVFQDGVLVRKERDLDQDGRPDQFTFYEGGRVVRKERDTNGDGKVDVWEYFQKGKLDRLGEDVDFDGTVDKWIEGDVAVSPP